MTEDAKPAKADGDATVTDEQLRKAEAEEGATKRLAGWAGAIVTAIAVDGISRHGSLRPRAAAPPPKAHV
jgi:hypothetical protein